MKRDRREYWQSYYAANKERLKALKAEKRLDYYKTRGRFLRTGWTDEEYQEAILRQEGKCYICGKMPTRSVLCADHCHKTGKKGKLLCVKCNVDLDALEGPMAAAYAAYLVEVR